MTQAQKIKELLELLDHTSMRVYVLERVVFELCALRSVHPPYLHEWRKAIADWPERKPELTAIAGHIATDLASRPRP